MKFVLTAIAFVFSASAFAEKDVCKDFFSCGTYTMKWTAEGQKQAVTTITIRSTGPNTAQFMYMTSIGGGTPDGWDLAVAFEDNGSFKMTIHDNVNYANGICFDKICTYGMHPWKPEGQTETIGNAGMLRFKDGQLEYVLMAGTPIENEKGLQVFTKQEQPH